MVVCPALTLPGPSSGYCWSKWRRNDKQVRTLGLGIKERDVSCFLKPAIPNLLFVTVVSMSAPTLRSFRNVPGADAQQQSQPSEDVEPVPITGHSTLLGSVLSHSAPTESDQEYKGSLMCAQALESHEHRNIWSSQNREILTARAGYWFSHQGLFTCLRKTANKLLNLILHLLRNKNHYIHTKLDLAFISA